MLASGERLGTGQGYQCGQARPWEGTSTIDSVDFRTYTNRRICSFKIATGSSDTEDNTMVRVFSGGITGIGCGCPTDVTHETRDSVERFLSKVPKKIIGTDETDVSGLHRRLDSIALGNTSAKAAVDLAIHDLLAKRAGLPLHRFLGGSGTDRMLTDMTIGIESKEVTIQKAVKHHREGFRALKVKVGLDFESDIRRVAAIRDALGKGVEIRVDANQGYSVEQAKRFCEEMHTLGVVFVEQPVKAEDYAGLKAVKEGSRVPIMADECVRSLEDARRIARDGAADLMNIKLMKSGGLMQAVQINSVAEAAGIGTMVGCMGEIQASIAAGLHFALSSENVKYADLDSHFNIIDDPSSGLVFEEGHLVAPDGPGLGISIRDHDM